MEWQLQDAKARFSELVETALRDGPQDVTRRGAPAVVVISAEAFLELQGKRPALPDALIGAPAAARRLLEPGATP